MCFENTTVCRINALVLSLTTYCARGGALSRAKTQHQGSGCLRGGQAKHVRVDCARLPCPLGHYGGEAHALRRTGLGGTPPEAMEGVPGCVGEASPEELVPEDGGELPGGEGDPGPREEGGRELS